MIPLMKYGPIANVEMLEGELRTLKSANLLAEEKPAVLQSTSVQREMTVYFGPARTQYQHLPGNTETTVRDTQWGLMIPVIRYGLIANVKILEGELRTLKSAKLLAE